MAENSYEEIATTNSEEHPCESNRDLRWAVDETKFFQFINGCVKSCEEWSLKIIRHERLQTLYMIYAMGVAIVSYFIILYLLCGEEASIFNGPIFQISLLFLIAAIVGKLTKFFGLTADFGYVLTGLICRQIVNVSDHFVGPNATYGGKMFSLRYFIITIFIIRQGLSFNKIKLKSSYYLQPVSFLILYLSLVPAIAETSVVMYSSYRLLQLPLIWATLLGTIVSAVSYEIIYSGLKKLNLHNYFKESVFNTLITSAIFVEIITVAMFSFIFDIIYYTEMLHYGPETIFLKHIITVMAGSVVGVLVGIFLLFAPHYKRHNVFIWRTVLSLMIGYMWIFGAQTHQYYGAGIVACLTFSFAFGLGWKHQNKKDAMKYQQVIDDMWKIAKVIVFTLIGAEMCKLDIDINEVNVSLLCVEVVCLGLLTRAVILLVTFKFQNGFRNKDQSFIILSFFSKSSMPAVLGPFALSVIYGTKFYPTAMATMYSNLIIDVCGISILIAAPISALLMKYVGRRLLPTDNDPNYFLPISQH